MPINGEVAANQAEELARLQPGVEHGADNNTMPKAKDGAVCSPGTSDETKILSVKYAKPSAMRRIAYDVTCTMTSEPKAGRAHGLAITVAS